MNYLDIDNLDNFAKAVQIVRKTNIRNKSKSIVLMDTSEKV